jgi:glyoxylase-like metal-dependent hydrolase (beta-lactamase superfamily II)
LLIEGEDSLTLVDTGFGIRDYASPSRHVELFIRMNGIPRDINETAVNQVTNLGFKPEDIRQIVMTHLHLDHVGGVADFPWAEIHVLKTEFESAINPRKLSWVDRIGYVREHLGSSTNWILHSHQGDEWFGLKCVPLIKELSHNILLIPLRGHSQGHCGVAVETENGWLLHCGDAYVRQMQIDVDEPQDPFPFFVRPLSRIMFPLNSIERVRKLRREHGEQIRLFSSHDPIEYSRLRGISIEAAIGLSPGPRGSDE